MCTENEEGWKHIYVNQGAYLHIQHFNSGPPTLRPAMMDALFIFCIFKDFSSPRTLLYVKTVISMQTELELLTSRPMLSNTVATKH